MKTNIIMLLLLLVALPLSAKQIEREIEIKSKKQIMLEKKLREIIFKKVNFQGANIADVFKFLRQESKKNDPFKKGVNIITPGFKNSKTTITLELNNLPLSEVLRYVCITANLQYRVEDFAVIIQHKKKP